MSNRKSTRATAFGFVGESAFDVHALVHDSDACFSPSSLFFNYHKSTKGTIKSSRSIHNKGDLIMYLSFQEKSIWFSLVTTIVIFGFYFGRVFRIFLDPRIPGPALIGLFIGTIVLIVLVQIAGQTILAVANRREAEKGKDERGRLVELKATRISYFILVLGVWVAGASMFVSSAPLFMANIIMFFFILSEVVGYVAQLIYYRRGV
jgi:uncharacterized membrane protein